MSDPDQETWRRNPLGAAEQEELEDFAEAAAAAAVEAAVEAFGWETPKAIDPFKTGAVGDGIALDTDALNEAIASGKDVLLRPGATYLVDGPLRFSETPGQRLIGNGAALKRRSQFGSTLAEAANAGAGEIVVVDGTDFRVGQQITLWDGVTTDPGDGGYEFTPLNAPPTIIAKVGNTLTLSDELQGAYEVGADVLLAFQTIIVTAPDVVIDGLEIDGNRAQYDFSRFQVLQEVAASQGADGFTLQNCRIHDAPGEAVVAVDHDSTRILSNTILDCDGNGVHIGANEAIGTRGARIVGNHIENCNLQSNGAIGHDDGCVAISLYNADYLIEGNYLRSALCGVGRIQSIPENSNASIVHNEIRDMTRNAIDGFQGTDASYAENILIEGNRIYDSIEFRFTTALDEAASDFVENWMIRGNYFHKTPVVLDYVARTAFQGNTLDGGDDEEIVLLSVRGARDCEMTGNTYIGGAYGVKFFVAVVPGYDYGGGGGGGGEPPPEPDFGDAAGFTRNVAVGGTFYGQINGAVHQTLVGTRGISIEGQVRPNLETMASDYIGIVAGEATKVSAKVTLPSDAPATAKGIELRESAVCKNSEVRAQGSGAKTIHVVERPPNLLEAIDSHNFETDTGDWVTGGYGAINPATSLTRVIADPFSGAACGRVITPGAAIKEGVAVDFGPVDEDEPYIGSIHLRGDSGGEEVEVFIYDRVTGTSPEGSPVTLTLTTEWQRLFAVAGSGDERRWFPEGTNANATLVVRNQGTAAYTYFIDAGQVVQSDEVVSFYDSAVDLGEAILKNNETDAAIVDDAAATILGGNELVGV